MAAKGELVPVDGNEIEPVEFVDAELLDMPKRASLNGVEMVMHDLGEQSRRSIGRFDLVVKRYRLIPAQPSIEAPVIDTEIDGLPEIGE